MKRNAFVGIACTLLAVSVIVGCADGGAKLFSRSSSDNDIRVSQSLPSIASQTSSEKQAVEDQSQSTVELAAAENESNTTLVSAVSPAMPLTPSLITLPASGDLSETISGAPGTVVLDFYADWCGPCRTQGKILHEVESAASESRTLMVKINVDEHPQLARQLQVSSLPTLMVVKNGQVIERQSGIASKDRLIRWMQ